MTSATKSSVRRSAAFGSVTVLFEHAAAPGRRRIPQRPRRRFPSAAIVGARFLATLAEGGDQLAARCRRSKRVESTSGRQPRRRDEPRRADRPRQRRVVPSRRVASCREGAAAGAIGRCARAHEDIVLGNDRVPHSTSVTRRAGSPPLARAAEIDFTRESTCVGTIVVGAGRSAAVCYRLGEHRWHVLTIRGSGC